MKGLYLIVFFCWVTAVRANVDIRTGNFYTTFTDVLFDETYDLKVLRVYNSKSDFIGLFGYGWGSNWETRVKVLSTDRMLIQDFGGGSKTYFKADRRGPGGVFESEQYGYEVLTKTGDGFKRLTREGASEYFNQQGYLTEVINKNGDQIIQLSYGAYNKLSQVSDNLGHSLVFSYNERGFVQSISGAGTSTARYRYAFNEGTVVLTSSEDIGNNHYQFQYDGKNRMTSVNYADGSLKTIDYDRNGLASKETQKNGAYMLFSYKGDNNRDPELHLEREVNSYSADGKWLKGTTKEFKFKRDENGHLLLTLYRSYNKGPGMRMKFKLKTSGSPVEKFTSIFEF